MPGPAKAGCGSRKSVAGISDARRFRLENRPEERCGLRRILADLFGKEAFGRRNMLMDAILYKVEAGLVNSGGGGHHTYNFATGGAEGRRSGQMLCFPHFWNSPLSNEIVTINIGRTVISGRYSPMLEQIFVRIGKNDNPNYQ
jgi:hypothetical protein